MIRVYHSHTPQTEPRHHEEESQSTYSQKTSVRQLKQSNQLSLLVEMIANLERALSNA